MLVLNINFFNLCLQLSQQNSPVRVKKLNLKHYD